VWLSALSEEYGRRFTLDDIPEGEILKWKEMGYHAIWLMGIWQSSLHSAALCRASEGLRQEIGRLLGDIRDGDIDGSPYAVAGYEVDPALGGDDALCAFRERLALYGLLLVLDFVPNHLAVDHPWVSTRPEWFICGVPDQVAANPNAFFHVGNIPVAHGRDPHFPPWTDTAQLNYFKPEVHDAMLNELTRVAERCDGVRCDMAMLLLPQVFGSVWEWAGNGAGEPACFWDHAIASVKNRTPEFRFIAEAYWGLERELQGKGFDYTYDKPLYDHLVSNCNAEIHRHLEATHESRHRAVRFIENHDEPRAASVFPATHGKTAAAVILTLPGATLIHQGQEHGWRIRFPVQMRRKPLEPSDVELEEFYRKIIKVARSKPIQEGEWVKLFPESEKSEELLAYQWSCPESGEGLLLIANFAGRLQVGSVKALCPNGSEHAVNVEELVKGESVDRKEIDCTEGNIPFRLAPWEFTVIRISDIKKEAG
jgi:glycosidase